MMPLYPSKAFGLTDLHCNSIFSGATASFVALLNTTDQVLFTSTSPDKCLRILHFNYNPNVAMGHIVLSNRTSDNRLFAKPSEHKTMIW